MLSTANARRLHAAARAIQLDVPRRGRPTDEGSVPESEQVLPHSIVRGTRGYIERVVQQVNGTYERGWFDACAVMIRRLLETVIIEAFEANGLANSIKNSDADFLPLSQLVDKALAEKSWNLGRNTRRALPRLKGVGDRSAHSRRFIAHRRDIEQHIVDLRDAVQEFVFITGLK